MTSTNNVKKDLLICIVSFADIDECMGDHGCNQTCINTPGSYYCNCERGFQLINSTECDGTDK